MAIYTFSKQITSDNSNALSGTFAAVAPESSRQVRVGWTSTDSDTLGSVYINGETMSRDSGPSLGCYADNTGNPLSNLNGWMEKNIDPGQGNFELLVDINIVTAAVVQIYVQYS